MTAVRSLRIGDDIVLRTDPGGDARETVTVTGFEDLESTRQIRVLVRFPDNNIGALQFAPDEKVRRVVEYGEEPGGIVMVSGDELWKWVD